MKVNDTGGVYFVTAFSGLYAPYWRDDARGYTFCLLCVRVCVCVVAK